MADELSGLYVLNGEPKKKKKKENYSFVYSLKDAHCFPSQLCLSSSEHIHMVGLYSSMHPFTYKAPVGIPPPNTHTRRTTPSKPLLYYYCHLRAEIWPRWPSDLSEAWVPGENTATARTALHCDVRVYGHCDICARILITLCVFSPLASMREQQTAMFGSNKPDFKLLKSSRYTL